MDLLQLWQNIIQEARDLATAVERLPDECECGDGEAHLAGRCLCCGGHTPGDHSAEHRNCIEVISHLQADLTVLGQDMSIAGPELEAVGVETHRLELRRGFFLAADDLEAILEAFRHLTESVAGFRRECTISRMRAIKRRCLEFRDHCERVNAEVAGSIQQLADPSSANQGGRAHEQNRGKR